MKVSVAGKAWHRNKHLALPQWPPLLPPTAPSVYQAPLSRREACVVELFFSVQQRT